MQVTETLSSGLKREYKVVVAAAELDTEALPSLMRKVLVKARIEIRPV